MTYEKIRAQIKTILKRDTALFAERLAKPATGPKLSDRAISVYECLKNKDFGGYREPLRAIMSLALGEELPPLKESSTLFNDSGYIALVTTSNAVSGHEYHLNQVAAKLPGFNFDYNDQFVKESGRVGGHMTSDVKEFRVATDAEIDQYVEKLTADTMAYMQKHVVILELPAEAGIVKRKSRAKKAEAKPSDPAPAAPKAEEVKAGEAKAEAKPLAPAAA